MDSLLTTQELECIQRSRSVKCNIQDLPSYRTGLPYYNLTVVTQNIVSIYRNLDDLLITMSELDCIADILILTECRIDPTKQIPCIQNYTNYQSNKLLNQNDGVAVYINNRYRATVLELNLTDATGLQIEIANCIFFCIYRSPSTLDSEKFTNSLNSQLEITSHYKNVFVIGDININLLPTSEERPQYRRNRLGYLNMLALHGLLPGHCLPTRSNTCLDHVMLKLDPNLNQTFVAVLNTTVTDHNLVLLQMSNIPMAKPVKRSKTITDFETAYKTLLKTDLPMQITCNDPEVFAVKLIDLIKAAVQSNSKVIQFSSHKKIIKPWLTPGALKCLRLRNKMQLKLRKDPSNAILAITYKRFRNYCSNLIKKLKCRYYSDQLNDSVTKPRKFWSTVNEITQYKPPKTTNVALLDLKPSPEDSVNSVNNFFASIGANLADVIIKQSGQRRDSAPLTPGLDICSSFVLFDTDIREVETTLLSLIRQALRAGTVSALHFLNMQNPLLSPIFVPL